MPIGICCCSFLSELAPRKVKMLIKPAGNVGCHSFCCNRLFGYRCCWSWHIPAFRFAQWPECVEDGSVYWQVMALPPLLPSVKMRYMRYLIVLKEASLALGANKWQTLFKVTLPAASWTDSRRYAWPGQGFGWNHDRSWQQEMFRPCPKASSIPYITITATIAIEMGEVLIIQRIILRCLLSQPSSSCFHYWPTWQVNILLTNGKIFHEKAFQNTFFLVLLAGCTFISCLFWE